MGRATVREAHLDIAARRTFDAGNLRAQTYFSGYGWLEHHRNKWWEDEGYSPRDASYIVYSYGTPIGWEMPSASHSRDGETVIIIPEVRHSVTTSRHQGVVKRGFKRRLPEPDTYLVE